MNTLNIHNRKAFTMVELIFVIVILGILASVAIPRLAATRDDAYIAQGRANILAIRSGIISERQGRMFRGDSTYATTLDNAVINTVSVALFDSSNTGNAILQNAVISKNSDGGWMKTQLDPPQYSFQLMGINVIFDYTTATGVFNCNRAHATYGTQCQFLTE